jgi:glucose/arabinose dehydrogenase
MPRPRCEQASDEELLIMKTSHFTGIVLACAAVLAAPAATAQRKHIVGVPAPVHQAAPPGVATFGLPNPAGLAPPTVPNVASPGVAPGSPAIDAGIATPTVAGGGGGVVVMQQSALGANAMGAGPSVRGPLSAVDIARAFFEADVNHDGQLSRAEAQRLSVPLGASFDDLDRDHDGFLSRFEYQDAFQ